MSLKLTDFIPSLPPPVCGIVWDYEAGEQADLIRRDRTLHPSEKSEYFRRQVQSEYDRNLRLFWVSLIYLSTTDTNMTQGAFGREFKKICAAHPEWFDDADREFCEIVASLENCSHSSKFNSQNFAEQTSTDPPLSLTPLDSIPCLYPRVSTATHYCRARI